MALKLIVAAIVWLFGTFLILDGLLPMRSEGPNPAWHEVAIGTFVFAVGLKLRRRAFQDSANRPKS